MQSGFLEASSLVAALHGSEKFRADMDKARADLASLRQAAPKAPDARMCRLEADAALHSPLFREQPALP